MKANLLGNTGLKVSLIGFGASPLGDVFHKTDPAEGIRAVHLAIDRGINFFDVSPYYGNTLAEERLGAALEGRRDKVILATKVGRYGGDSFDFSAKRVKESIDESLARLRTDYVDLLQAHDIEFGDERQIVEETLPALRELQQSGKTRFIGITGYPLKMLKRVAEAGHADTILSYCRYNLLITDMDDVLAPLASMNGSQPKSGIGLINASGLHMGILTQRGAPQWHPAPEKVKEAGLKMAEFCRGRGVDISDIALRFCFDYSYAASTLVGMSTSAHVERNLKVLEVANDPQLVEELRRLAGPALDVVWPSGKPENHD